MKHLKFFLPAVFALVLAPNVHAALAPGKVQALLVVGDVQLVDAANNRKPLTKGMTFEEGNTVIAGAASGATLVFSNGATMRVKENGQLKIDKFEQAPFDENKEGTFMRLSRDPSQSVTELDLRNGTLQGEVKELNKTENSSFNVKTPAGSAGIRGTIVSITVTRDVNGNVTGVTANCVTGNIAFTPAPGVNASFSNTTNNASAGVNVNAGGAVQVSLTTNASGQLVASVSGATVNSAQATQAVADLFAAINTIRAASNLAPLAPPVVTAGNTSSVTDSSGNTVSQTTQVNLDPGTSASGTGTLFTASPTTSNNGTPTGGTGASTSGTSGTGSGAGINTNPTLSAQGSTGGSTGTGSAASGSGS